MSKFENVKVGDVVQCRRHFTDTDRTVTHVTPKQFVCAGMGNEYRYWKKNGHAVGDKGCAISIREGSSHAPE